MSRLKQRYTKEIAPAMSKEYGYKNVMAIPKLEKIVINIGLGEAIRATIGSRFKVVETLEPGTWNVEP